jgi:hypothetical protein
METLPRPSSAPILVPMMPSTMIVENFQVTAGICLGVVLAAAGIFVFSMPLYRSPVDAAMLGGHVEHHYAAADVRHAFRIRGFGLPTASAANSGLTLSGSNPDLYVFVARRNADAGRRDPDAYEQRIGNVLVHYAGADKGVHRRVKAAVAALRRS